MLRPPVRLGKTRRFTFQVGRVPPTGETAQTETTHAIASVRRMIDSFQSIVTGWPTRARERGLGLFYAPAETPRRKWG